MPTLQQIWSNEAGWKQKQLGWKPGAKTSPIQNQISGENQTVGVALFHELYAGFFSRLFFGEDSQKESKVPSDFVFF